MADQQLSREQFHEVMQRVIAGAPDGLSKPDFDALLSREVAKAGIKVDYGSDD